MLLTIEQAREILLAALHNFCLDFNSALTTPILEADIAGYLYHRIVANGCPPHQVYLASRVCGELARKRKPDIVIGTLNKDTACVAPVLICELKVFQRWGHSERQMKRRFAGLLTKDLVHLEESAGILPEGRLEVVLDLFVSPLRRGYLTGAWEGQARVSLVAKRCREIGATFIWIHPHRDHDDVVLEIVP